MQKPHETLKDLHGFSVYLEGAKMFIFVVVVKLDFLPIYVPFPITAHLYGVVPTVFWYSTQSNEDQQRLDAGLNGFDAFRPEFDFALKIVALFAAFAFLWTFIHAFLHQLLPLSICKMVESLYEALTSLG